MSLAVGSVRTKTAADWTRADLLDVVASQRWLQHSMPYRHVTASDVFAPEFYDLLVSEVLTRREAGVGRPGEPHRFSANMPNSDAYAWNVLPDITGALSVFYSRVWHELVTELAGCECSGDVNAAVHWHPPGTANGKVHRDLGVGYFSEQRREDGINPMDLARCSYTRGVLHGTRGIGRRVVRAVTMIYYLVNDDWCPAQGGETGLYESIGQEVEEPSLRIPPLNNCLLAFKNDDHSFHSFLSNRTHRHSVILWLHQEWEIALEALGAHAITNWGLTPEPQPISRRAEDHESTSDSRRRG